MSASRTIPSRSPTITPHIESVCANHTRICPTNSNKRASSPLYPGSMTSNSISVSANLNAALHTAESNYLPLQNLCFRAIGASEATQVRRDRVEAVIDEEWDLVAPEICRIRPPMEQEHRLTAAVVFHMNRNTVDLQHFRLPFSLCQH